MIGPYAVREFRTSSYAQTLLVYVKYFVEWSSETIYVQLYTHKSKLRTPILYSFSQNPITVQKYVRAYTRNYNSIFGYMYEQIYIYVVVTAYEGQQNCPECSAITRGRELERVIERYLSLHYA